MATLNFLSNISLNLNELQNAKFQILIVDPENLVEGLFWYNSTQKVLKYYNGTQTVVLSKAFDLNSLTSKTTISDADAIPFYDSSAGENKKITWSSLSSLLLLKPINGDATSKNIVTDANGNAVYEDKPTLGTVASRDVATIGLNAAADDEKIPTSTQIKTYVTDQLATLSGAFIYKGTLGVDGTITVLPTTYDIGWAYKIITAGTYAGQTCEVGDLISAIVQRTGSGNVNTDWTVIQNNTDVMTGATAEAAGAIGFVPAPAAGKQLSYLRGDGLWVIPNNYFVNSITITDDTASNANNPLKITLGRNDSQNVIGNLPKVSSTSAGIVPKGTTVATQTQTTKFLREDGTWAAPLFSTLAKYIFTNPELTVSGGQCTWTITHNLNTKDFVYILRNTNDNEVFLTEGVFTDVNTLTIYINSTDTIAAGDYSITIIG